MPTSDHLNLPGSATRNLAITVGLIASVLLACGGTVPVVALDEDSDSASDDSNAPPVDFLGEECDPYADECAEGQKCAPIALVPYASIFQEYRCVWIYEFPAEFGDECISWGLRPESYDNCDEGLVCWGAKDPVLPPDGQVSLPAALSLSANLEPAAPLDGEEIGRCESLCQGSPDDPDCGSKWNWCVSSNGVDLCVSTCNPLEQTCAEQMGCIWDDWRDTFNCLHLVVTTVGVGEDCTGCGICCEEGLHCDPAEQVPGCEGESCCNGWCTIDGELPCALEGQVCEKYWPQGDEPPGQELLGSCTIG